MEEALDGPKADLLLFLLYIIYLCVGAVDKLLLGSVRARNITVEISPTPHSVVGWGLLTKK